MRYKIVALFSLLFMWSTITSGQDLDEEGNWFKLVRDRDDYSSRFDFTRAYTKEDVISAASLYAKIESVRPTSEWEGVYITQIAVGEAELRWRTNEGYVFHSVYHTLGSLEYGSVLYTNTSIRLVTGKTGARQKSALFSDELVEVRIGRKHYLVPKSRLKDFAERAVGREATVADEWSFWQRADETDIQAEGLPVFPSQYSRFTVLPIKTKVLRVGRRTVVRSEYTTKEVNYDDIYIFVTLSGGSTKGMKLGMDFFIPALGEWVELVRVGKSSSVGRIRRDFSLEGTEQCWDAEEGSGNSFPCKNLIKGLAGITRADDYF